MGFNLSLESEGAIYANYLLKNKPEAKVAILYQNDDLGKDVRAGVKKVLSGSNSKMIVAEVSYEVTDPTVDSQILTLRASGADTLINITTPKAAAQSLRKVYDLGWKPLHIIASSGSSIGTVLMPAGPEKSIGVITARYTKDPNDPLWSDDPEMQTFLAFMKRYNPDADLRDGNNPYGYVAAQLMVRLLKQCGNDLTRENLIRQAGNLQDVQVPMLLPGILLNTRPDDFSAVKQAQLARFNGTQWVRFGEVLGR